MRFTLRPISGNTDHIGTTLVCDEKTGLMFMATRSNFTTAMVDYVNEYDTRLEALENDAQQRLDALADTVPGLTE